MTEKTIHNRLTVVETVYYQAAQREPMAVDSRFSRELQSFEQPYIRDLRLDAADGWIPLDLGWIETVGMLCIRNDAGRYARTIPTPEEHEATAKQVLHLALDTTVNWADGPAGYWEILPGESFRGVPSSREIFVRSRYGVIPITVYAVPR